MFRNNTPVTIKNMGTAKRKKAWKLPMSVWSTCPLEMLKRWIEITAKIAMVFNKSKYKILSFFKISPVTVNNLYKEYNKSIEKLKEIYTWVLKFSFKFINFKIPMHFRAIAHELLSMESQAIFASQNPSLFQNFTTLFSCNFCFEYYLI